MREEETQLFVNATQSAKEEFYLDAISDFKKLIIEFPDSELVDDAYYNIGLCYYNMNQFDKAIVSFKNVIDEYPDGVISILIGGNEYGRTSAKCWYGIMNCFLAMGSINEADLALKELIKFNDSYISDNQGIKITFAAQAQKVFDRVINQSKINNIE